MKNLPNKFILTALAFAGGILLTRFLRKKIGDKSQIPSKITNLQPPNGDYVKVPGQFEQAVEPDESANFSSNVSGTSDIILDGMDEEQASNLLEELK